MATEEDNHLLFFTVTKSSASSTCKERSKVLFQQQNTAHPLMGEKIASFSAKAEPSRGYPIKESLVVQENSLTKNTQSTFRSE